MTNFLLEIALKAARIPPVQIFKTGASSKTWPKELLQKTLSDNATLSSEHPGSLYPQHVGPELYTINY